MTSLLSRACRLRSLPPRSPVLLLGLLQAGPDQLDIVFGRLGSPLRFLLEGMQHVDRMLEPDRVDASISVPLEVLYDLDTVTSAEALQDFGARRPLALLGQVKGMPHVLPRLLRKRDQILAARTHELQRT